MLRGRLSTNALNPHIRRCHGSSTYIPKTMIYWSKKPLGIIFPCVSTLNMMPSLEGVAKHIYIYIVYSNLYIENIKFWTVEIFPFAIYSVGAIREPQCWSIWLWIKMWITPMWIRRHRWWCMYTNIQIYIWTHYTFIYIMWSPFAHLLRWQWEIIPHNRHSCVSTI